MIVKSVTVSLPSPQAMVDMRFLYLLTLGLSVWSLFQAGTSHLTPKTAAVCYTEIPLLSHGGPSTDRYIFDALRNPSGVSDCPFIKPVYGDESCRQRWQTCHH
jgi:hypothetical protein